MVVLPLGLLALGILGCILCFDDEIEQIFAGGVVNRNQHASVQEGGESISFREIANNHYIVKYNRGHEAQDEEDSSNE